MSQGITEQEFEAILREAKLAVDDPSDIRGSLTKLLKELREYREANINVCFGSSSELMDSSDDLPNTGKS